MTQCTPVTNPVGCHSLLLFRILSLTGYEISVPKFYFGPTFDHRPLRSVQTGDPFPANLHLPPHKCRFILMNSLSALLF